MKKKYWDISRILEKNARYNIVIGERSNGKSYGTYDYCIREYCKGNGAFAIIRRWKDDITRSRATTFFNPHIENGVIEKYTNGEFNDVIYRNRRWYLCKTHPETNDPAIEDSHPFAYSFSLNDVEHDKATQFPRIRNIVFDEFLARRIYLPDEFNLFMNTLSTIIRDRDNVRIFMLGNTINPYCPYFTEMGITNIKNMKKGDIDIYEYGTSGLRVAVEFSDSPVKHKNSDVYFAFDNPKLNMIKGDGSVWELDIFPHLTDKFDKNDIVFSYFILFDRDTFQCDVIKKENKSFTYIHRKTTPIKNDSKDLIYSTNINPKRNYRTRITRPYFDFEKKLAEFFKYDKVFYQDNQVGNAIANYLQWCKQ